MFKKIDTRRLVWNGWFWTVGSENVDTYFTRFLRVLSFCMEVSNGIVECKRRFVIGQKGLEFMWLVKSMF